MAAALIIKRKIATKLASTITRRWDTTRTVVVSTQQQRFANRCINDQHVRPRAAAEKSKCFIPRRRHYGTPLFSATDTNKLGRATGDYEYDLAVDKAIQHYHEHIKGEEEEGRGIMVHPERGASEYLMGVLMYHILLKTTWGQKYVSVYVAHGTYDPVKMEHEALKLVLFRKVDTNVKLPLRGVPGGIRWPVCPRNNPLIAAAARFALAQHNKEGKLTHLIRATCEMVGDYEIFRMTFEGEVSGKSSSMYDAVVLVLGKNPEEMELVMFGVSDGWGMYRPEDHLVDWYEYGDEEDEEDEEYEYRYEGDKCDIDDPHVTAAARFALAQYNEKDRVRLDNKKDQVRRVVGATRRTYLGDEILSMKFDGELDGSWFYKAIVLVPVSDPENMRLAYCGHNWDDPDPYIHDNKSWHPLDITEFEYGCEECDIDDPRVTGAARLALASYNEKDKLLRVVKAISQKTSRDDGVTYTVRFVGEDHPLRTYVAKLSVPHETNRVRYASNDHLLRTSVATISVPREDPKYMQVEFVFPEVNGPSRQYVYPEPEEYTKFIFEDEVLDKYWSLSGLCRRSLIKNIKR